MPASAERLPFSEAIDYFRNKTRLPSSGWTDLWQEQHSHAFVVAGAAHDGLVEDFYNAIRQAQARERIDVVVHNAAAFPIRSAALPKIRS